MRERYRLNFIVDDEHKLIVIRPIGDMPAMEFVERLFAAYEGVDRPWLYRRVNDFRRFDGFLDNDVLAEIARRWAALSGGLDYHAYVAVVTTDTLDRLRLPSVSPQFAKETICLFTDYHEAVGWLLAEDRDTYLAGLGEAYMPARHADEIHIE